MHAETTYLTDIEIKGLLKADRTAGTMALYDRYISPLILAIYHIAREREAVDEILIKTLVIASKTYCSNYQQKEKLLPWVMAIAREQANFFTMEKN